MKERFRQDLATFRPNMLQLFKWYSEQRFPCVMNNLLNSPEKFQCKQNKWQTWQNQDCWNHDPFLEFYFTNVNVCDQNLQKLIIAQNSYKS